MEETLEVMNEVVSVRDQLIQDRTNTEETASKQNETGNDTSIQK